MITELQNYTKEMIAEHDNDIDVQTVSNNYYF